MIERSPMKVATVAVEQRGCNRQKVIETLSMHKCIVDAPESES